MGFVKASSNKEKTDKLKEECVLTILDSKGVDIAEFKNSELYLASQKRLFFNHLYYVLHGSLDGDKYSNKCEIDLNQLKITFENNILEVSFPQVNYKYCIINEMLSVDGENTYLSGFVATVNAPAIPFEKQIEALKQFHDDMKGYRLRREDALEKSWEFAKNFKVR